MMHVRDQESRLSEDIVRCSEHIVVQEWATHVENRMISSIIINMCEYLSSVSMNMPVTDDWMIYQTSYSLDNANKEKMASHILFLV